MRSIWATAAASLIALSAATATAQQTEGALPARLAVALRDFQRLRQASYDVLASVQPRPGEWVASAKPWGEPLAESLRQIGALLAAGDDPARIDAALDEGWQRYLRARDELLPRPAAHRAFRQAWLGEDLAQDLEASLRALEWEGELPDSVAVPVRPEAAFRLEALLEAIRDGNDRVRSAPLDERTALIKEQRRLIQDAVLTLATLGSENSRVAATDVALATPEAREQVLEEAADDSDLFRIQAWDTVPLLDVEWRGFPARFRIERVVFCSQELTQAFEGLHFPLVGVPSGDVHLEAQVRVDGETCYVPASAQIGLDEVRHTVTFDWAQRTPEPTLDPQR